MLRRTALLLVLLSSNFALTQLTEFPKTIPGTVNMPRLSEPPMKTVKPVYPQESLQKWIQGTVTLDAVIGTTGEVEMLGCDGYCQAFPRDMAEAAADAVRQWRWNPILVKGSPARVRTRIAVPFVLDEHSPAISVCNLLRDPKSFVGKNLNVFGTVKREHGIKVLTSAECEGAVEFEDDSAITPPQKDAKYAAMQQGLAGGSASIAARGLFRDENRPGAYPGYRLILDRVLKVTQ